LFGLILLGIVVARKSRMTIILIGHCVLLTAAYLILNVPSYHWYYSPYIASFILLSSVGLGYVFKGNCSNLIKKLIPTCLAVVGVSLVIFQIPETIVRIRNSKPQYLEYKKIGTWLKYNTAPDSDIAVMEIGTIGYYSHRKLIDILGLVTPGNARYIGEKRYDEWLTDYQPRYILTRDPTDPLEVAAARALRSGAYALDQRFQLPGYLLLVKIRAHDFSR
jgi:hypothetical protein